MSRLPLVIWLVAVWVALWGDLTAANVLSGVPAALAVTTVARRPEPEHHRWTRLQLGALLRFQLHFLGKLVEATAIVAWEIITPRSRVREGVVAVPLRGYSPFVTTVVANSVSLTPGTLTLEIADDGNALYVHVLHLHDADAVRREVQVLEELAIRAFGGTLEPGGPGGGGA